MTRVDRSIDRVSFISLASQARAAVLSAQCISALLHTSPIHLRGVMPGVAYRGEAGEPGEPGEAGEVKLNGIS